MKEKIIARTIKSKIKVFIGKIHYKLGKKNLKKYRFSTKDEKTRRKYLSKGVDHLAKYAGYLQKLS